MSKVIVICGATATGKSDIAIEVAKELGAEIINADSMQLYRGMEKTRFITCVIRLIM